MDNLKSPAYPQQTWEEISINREHNQIATYTDSRYPGFNKLEKASLIIAQGLVSKYNLSSPADQKIIAQLAVELATEVLKEANK